MDFRARPFFPVPHCPRPIRLSIKNTVSSLLLSFPHKGTVGRVPFFKGASAPDEQPVIASANCVTPSVKLERVKRGRTLNELSLGCMKG